MADIYSILAQKNTQTSVKPVSSGVDNSIYGLLAKNNQMRFGIYEEEDTDYNKGGLFGGIGYTLGKLGTGAFGILEGIWDYTAGGVAKFFGADEWAEEQFANNIAGNWNQDLDDWYNPSSGMKVVGDVASGIGNSLVGMGAVAGAAAIAAFSGGSLSGLSASIIAGVTIGLGAAGMATTEAYEKTGQLGGKEFAYGALSGLTEAALEGITGAAGKVGGKLFAKQTAKTVAKKTILKGVVSNFAGEAFEEGVSEILTPYFQRWTEVDPEAKNATWQQVGYAALVGGLSGALLGGIGDAYTTVKSINRGNVISKNTQHTEAVLGMARNFAQYETEHNTGREAYQYITGLVNQFDALDKGDGTLTIGQKKILGQMEVADVVLSVEPAVQRSKENIIANAQQFIDAVNARGLIDASTGKPIHIDSVEALVNNDALLTQFAVADSLGQLLMSKDSVYDFVVSKGKTDGIMQADFRNFQKEATAQEKASINELFGIDVDSITYDDFINKIQYTNRQVIETKQEAIQTRKQAKNAISQAINTNAEVSTVDNNTVYAEGMSVYKTKDGKYISVSKKGEQYYLYADGNISQPLTKAKLKAAIKILNGEQAKARVKEKSSTTVRATATQTTQEVKTNTPTVATTTETEVNNQGNTKPVVETTEKVEKTNTTGDKTNETKKVDNAPKSAVKKETTKVVKDGAESTSKNTVEKATTEKNSDVKEEKAENTAQKTTKTEDFGEKIGGARKDTWQKRGLLTTDLTAMNRREMQQHVKKENVWKRPDFVKAVAEGGDRGLLYAQNELYKSLNATPYVWRNVVNDTTSTAFQDAMEKYISEVREVQKIAESIKTKEDLGKITNFLIEKGYLKDTGSLYRRYSWTESYYESPAFYGSKIYETARTLEKGFDSLGETALIEGFGVDKADKLPNGYTIRRVNSYWDGSGTRYIIVKGGKHGSYASPYFNSFEDALAYGKEKYGTAETATTSTDGKKRRFVPEQLKDVHRNGLDYRTGKDATGDDFLRDFGIKGGEFGNWLSEVDRTTSLNYGYDAFCDLADALNIELKDISLNGTLSIGFGSRGQGLSGAAAHYEPARKVINLTKMNGAGSLAHEFWHAVEDYASGDTHQSDMASDFSKMPERTKNAGKELLNAINYKNTVVSIEEINENKAKNFERYKRHLTSVLDYQFKIFSESMTEEERVKEASLYRYQRTPNDADLQKYKSLRERALKGEKDTYTKFITGKENVADELNALLKEVKGRGIEKETRQSIASYVDSLANFSEQAVETQTKRVKTQFHEDAIAISRTYAKDGGYWDSNSEMLARAFASYIHTKTNGGNDYLSGHALSAAPVVKNGTLDVAYIYPHDTAEAEKIYKAFDNFFDAAKADGLFHEATREKPKTNIQYAMSEDTQLNTVPNGSKGQKLKPLQMKHAESVARGNIKGYDSLTEAEKLEVEWTLASAWRAGKDTSEALKLARLSTAIGAGVGFADLSTKVADGKTIAPDAACYTMGGHITIYLNPNGKRTVESATLHELVHSLEGVDGYDELKAMAEKYYNEHPTEKKAIDDMYRDVYKNEQVKYAEEVLPSELTAHYVETMLAKRDMLAKLTQEKPTFTQKCIEKIKAIRKKLTATDTSADMSEVDMLEKRFTTIFNLNKGKIATNSSLSSVKLSIKKINGKDTVVVDTDQHIFDGIERENLGNVARDYIRERFRGKTIDGVTYSRTTEKEYTHSRDSHRLFNQNNAGYSAKMRASTELINLVKTGELIGNESAKHPKPVNAGGFDRYSVSFVLDGKTFTGELLIAKGADNIATFYDIVKIKESDSTNNNTEVAVRSNSLSTNSIVNNSENVNTESVKTTKKFALQTQNSQKVGDVSSDRFNSVEEVKNYYDKAIVKAYEKYKAVDPYSLRVNNEQRLSLKEYLDTRETLENQKKEMLKIVKKKIASVDSDGNALTASQQKYFRGSKVVDENGRLKVCYHGTSAKFNEFSYKYLGKNGTSYGKGFYFSDSADYSNSFATKDGSLMKVYLDIKKPLSLTKKNITVDKLRSFLTKLAKYETEDGINTLSDYADIDSYGVNAAINACIDVEYYMSSNDVDLIHGIFNGISGIELSDYYKLLTETLGYDGIIEKRDSETFYVTFQSNQSKNVTNTAPTSNADIRYALSPEDIKGSDRTMTELPDERISFRDVITRKKSVGDLKTQISEDSKEFTEGWQIATTNAQAGLERVLRETGNDKATAITNYVRAGKNAAYGALTAGQFSLDGETYLGESWEKIWKPVYAMDKKDGQAYKMFNLYLLHWHNTDRYAVGKPVFGTDVTVEDSIKAISEIEAEYPSFRKIAEKVWKYNDGELQIAVDSGMYSEEYAEVLREMYPHYVPTSRAEHRTPIGALQGKGNVRVNPNNRRAVGSDLDILPIDDVVAQQTIQRISSARINQMLLSMKNGTAHDEFKVIDAESETVDIDNDNLVTTFADKAKGKHQVTFWENGKSVTAEVSQNVFRGIESFMPSGDTTFNNTIINAVAKANSGFKKLVTAWNPFFVFFKNPIRDLQTALNYTRYSWKTYAKNFVKAGNEIRNNGRYWQEAQSAGILSASVYDYRKGLQYKNKGKWSKAIGKIESVSNAIEMKPRLAEYISARESGLSVQEALLQAQDVTTNFGRSGTLTKKANATFMPFLNPAVQGFSKMVRAYTGKDAAKSWANLIIRSLILGVGMSALNDLLNDDDEEYKNVSDYVKNNNYLLSLGDGQFLKIPKGRENGFIGELYLRAKRYANGEENAWEGTLESFMSNLTPTDNFTRTIFSPFVDISTNSTWYGGTIEGQKWNDTEPKNRYDESTSSISIWLGKVFNYSPIKIDYLLEQYGGVVTDILLPATNLEAETGVITQNMLVNSTTNSRWSTEFYSAIERYTYKKTAGDIQAKGVVKYLNNISGTVSEMYNQKRTIQGDKTLSNDEKLKQVKIIQAVINSLQKDAISNIKTLYEELGKYELTDDNFDMGYLNAVSSVVGEEYALKVYNKQVYEKAQMLNTMGIDYGTYFDYYFGLKSITADTNSNGSTVSGSKKANVIAYTMNLNLPTVQKLMLIMSAGYKISDGDIKGLTAKYAKTTVAKYITNLSVSREEKTKLAELFGFTVEGGKIYIN